MAFIVLPPLLLVVVVVIVASDLFLPLLFALPQQQQQQQQPGVTSASESYLTHIVKYPAEHNLFSKVLLQRTWKGV